MKVVTSRYVIRLCDAYFETLGINDAIAIDCMVHECLGLTTKTILNARTMLETLKTIMCSRTVYDGFDYWAKCTDLVAPHWSFSFE